MNEAKTNNEITIIEYCADGNLYVLTKSIENNSEYFRDNDKLQDLFRKLLPIALEKRHINIIVYLIEQGADINMKYVFTKLIYAVYINTEILKYLVDLGAAIETKYFNDGSTLLMFAVICRNIKCARLLIAREANINATDHRAVILHY